MNRVAVAKQLVRLAKALLAYRDADADDVQRHFVQMAREFKGNSEAPDFSDFYRDMGKAVKVWSARNGDTLTESDLKKMALNLKGKHPRGVADVALDLAVSEIF